MKGDLLVDLFKIYGENGDAISKQYAGSKAMHGAQLSVNENGDVSVEKRGNALIAVKRYFNNLLSDLEKQRSLLLFLGYYDHRKEKKHIWEIDFTKRCVDEPWLLDAAGWYARSVLSPLALELRKPLERFKDSKRAHLTS